MSDISDTIKKEEKKSLWKKIKKAGRIASYFLVGFTAFHLTTQTVYDARKNLEELFPTQAQTDFYDKFGIKLLANPEDLDSSMVRQLNKVVTTEMREKPFELDYIEIKSDNYLERSFMQQLENLLFLSYNGRYFPKSIELQKSAGEETMHHEIKHAKTFDLPKEERLKLEKEWSDLSANLTGESLYLGPFEQMANYTMLLSWTVSEDKKDDYKNKELGFITTYARTNVWEDIAEVCEEAETFTDRFHDYEYDEENRNPTITAKLKLAEKYGLVSKDITDYLKLLEFQYKNYQFDLYDGYSGFFKSKEKAEEFIEKTEEFLKKNKNSQYEVRVRYKQALAYKSIENNKIFENDFKEYDYTKTITALKSALKSEFKESGIYQTTLEHLRQIYHALKYEDKTGEATKNIKLMDEAIHEYRIREKADPAKLLVTGVNDFLAERGFFKAK